MILQPECPYCEKEMGLNFDEPGQWCHSENIPDGSFKENCNECGKEVVVISDWSPNFDTEKVEDY